MTFFMIGGIACVIVSIILIVLYLIIHRLDSTSIASKAIIWIGMLAGVAGASLLVVEFSFPNISHPRQLSVYDHFVEYYEDKYYTFIETYTEHEVVDEILEVKHEQLKTSSEEDINMTYFKTYVLYGANSELYDVTFLNKYEYNNDYSFQNVVSYEIK